MNSAVVKYIPFIIIFIAIVVSFTNYILLGPLKFTDKIPDLFFYLIYASIFYFILGYSISASAADAQCGKVKKTISIFHAFKTSIIAVLTYLIIYFIPFFKAPFNEMISNNQLANCVTETFFISLNIILISIINYFDSAKRSCLMTQKELEENMKQLDKLLNSKEKKQKKKRIIVKD